MARISGAARRRVGRRVLWGTGWLALALWGAAAAAAPPKLDALLGTTAAEAKRCDFLDPSYCLFPFPNDYFTVADGTTDTGRRVHFDAQSMPRSRIALDLPANPAEWNRNDGFSPGPMILLHVPGIDLAKTGAPPITDLSRSLAAASPVVLIDAATLQRVPLWVELDLNNVSSADRQALIIRPARSLQYGHRYIVALRNVRDPMGDLVPSSPAFQIYRDQLPSSLDYVNARRPHMESLFATLARAGVVRGSLYLAWDFTVASQRNLTSRLLHIRDDAFAALANGVPDYKITKVTNYTPAEDAKIARRVEGTVSVPSYLFVPDTEATLKPVLDQIEAILARGGNSPAALAQLQSLFALAADQDLPLTRFYYGPKLPGPGINDLPQRAPGATVQAPFLCVIPRAAFNGGSIRPARISLYGHGLFGARDEVNAGNVTDMANEHDFVFCATNWYGFSQGDLPNALVTLLDISNARSLFDTTEQGILNQLVLGRAMLSPKGFAANPAFQMGDPVRSVLDTTELYYDGNSQGGILGGALMGVAQDITRGVLGVPGMNYSLLLERSSDFPQYGQYLYDAYPDSFDQEFIFSLLQMLWDRAEAAAYAPAMTTQPLPNTPPHKVLMHVAFGDHQVSMWSAQIEARTNGARLHCPALEPGRNPDTVQFFQIPCLPASTAGYDGSAMVMWDSGPTKVTPPPTANLPPTTGQDPHEDPRATPAARLQKSEFLKPNGRVIDVCNGKPCGAAGYVPP